MSAERFAVHARTRRTRQPLDDTTMSLRRGCRVQRLYGSVVGAKAYQGLEFTFPRRHRFRHHLDRTNPTGRARLRRTNAGLRSAVIALRGQIHYTADRVAQRKVYSASLPAKDGNVRSSTSAISGLHGRTVDTRLAGQWEAIATATRSGVKSLLEAVAGEAVVWIAPSPDWVGDYIIAASVDAGEGSLSA